MTTVSEGPGIALEGPGMGVFWSGDSPTAFQRVKENYKRKGQFLGVTNSISKILEISYVRFCLRNEMYVQHKEIIEARIPWYWEILYILKSTLHIFHTWLASLHITHC